MQDTPANPYTVRLHSARLVNAYTGHLHLAGSRRNTQEDRGEERMYKVTINTEVDPFALFAAGAVGAWFMGHKIDHVVDNVIGDVKVLKDLSNEATMQKAKIAEKLKNSEKEMGSERQPHEGGDLESWGAAVGKFLVDAISQKREHLQTALKDDAVSTQKASEVDVVQSTKKQ